MFIVTGGAGFIGSALIWGINKRGIRDILVVDHVYHDEQEHNLAELRYEEHLEPDDFRKKLADGEYDNEKINGILHMGAISATTETNWDKLQDNNVNFTQEIIRWASDHDVRCIYASSGQAYGAGENGYSDDHSLFDQFTTITLYGKSKLITDIWARDGGYLDRVVGLRYFNVFGPNEYHKEDMRSVIAKKFDEVKRGEPMRLFKSNSPDFKDGEQKRDFVYVKDAVDATFFFLYHPEINGVFNIGTGIARTWVDVANAMFSALGKEPSIEYIEMPEQLKEHYQNYTLADVKKLRNTGYTKEMNSLEEAVKDYVQKYLIPHKHLTP